MGQFEIYPPNCGATGGPLPTPKDAGWIPACAGMTITTAGVEPPSSCPRKRASRYA